MAEHSVKHALLKEGEKKRAIAYCILFAVCIIVLVAVASQPMSYEDAQTASGVMFLFGLGFILGSIGIASTAVLIAFRFVKYRVLKS